MKPLKPLFLLLGTVLFALACGMETLSPTPSVNLPAETLTIIPLKTPRQARTPIPTPIFLFPLFLSPTSQALSFPAWVADFSNPILMALGGQDPVFEDDFSPICIDEYKRWKACSTPEQRIQSIPKLVLATAGPTLDLQPDLQNGYSLLNKGWFYFIPGSHKNPFYAHIQDETLLIKLPAENENKDYWVYSPKLVRKNFVLSFDFQFEETQPNDTVRFQFDQATDQSVALDLSKNQTWVLHWGSLTDWQAITGKFDYFPPKRITVLIIMRGEKCAVYLNDVPLTYLSNCRAGPIVRASPWAVTFHMLADPGHIAAATIDNVKLWDLDKISGLP